MNKDNIGLGAKTFSRVIAAVTMAMLFMLSGCGDADEDASAKMPSAARPVKVVTVTDSDMTEIRSFPGIVKAEQEIELSFRVGGPLVQYDLKIGEPVKKGDILARIDTRDFEIKVRKLVAELESAEARLSDAERDYERQKNLFAENAASQSKYDKTQMLVKTTRAGIESLKADLAAARNALADTRLTAPFDGVVNQKYTENHETVSPGMPVVSLLDVSSLEVATAVPEDVVIRASDFRRIQVSLDAYPGMKMDAALKEIGRQTSNTNQSYPLTALLQIPDGISVEPGMAAALHLRIFSGAREEGSVTLPAVAVFSDADGRSCVWKITDNTKTQRIRVETGSLKGDEIVILSGVSPGDRIVTAGARFLVEGQAVRLMDNGKGSAS